MYVKLATIKAVAARPTIHQILCVQVFDITARDVCPGEGGGGRGGAGGVAAGELGLVIIFV